MSRLLVTGGAGFIGSNLVRHVLGHTEHSVTVLDALTYAGNRANLAGLPADRLRFVHGDVRDAAVVDALVADSDAVIHAAAESHNDNALADPRVFADTNVLGTLTVLEAVRAHGVRLHHVSTDEVFGDLPLTSTERFTEASPYRPSSPYSATKASSDLLVRAWVRSYGIAATISASSNNFGPYQHVEKFLPRQITRVLSGERPRLYGTGRNVRDWIHVDDHSRAILAILERGELGETYLVGADGERSNTDLVRTVLRELGADPEGFDLVADRPGHDERYAIDATRLRTELGWTPEHGSVEDGVRATIAWYRENAGWWAQARVDAEARYAREGR